MIDARSNQNSKEKRLDPRTRNATQELGGGGERARGGSPPGKDVTIMSGEREQREARFERTRRWSRERAGSEVASDFFVAGRGDSLIPGLGVSKSRIKSEIRATEALLMSLAP